MLKLKIIWLQAIIVATTALVISCAAQDAQEKEHSHDGSQASLHSHAGTSVVQREVRRNVQKSEITIKGNFEGPAPDSKGMILICQLDLDSDQNRKIAMAELKEGKFEENLEVAGPFPAVITVMCQDESGLFIEQEFIIEEKDFEISGTMQERSELLADLRVVGSSFQQDYSEATEFVLSQSVGAEAELDNLHAVTMKREKIAPFFAADYNELSPSTLNELIELQAEVDAQANIVTQEYTKVVEEVRQRYGNTVVTAKVIGDFIRHNAHGMTGTLRLESARALEMLAEFDDPEVTGSHAFRFAMRMAEQVQSVMPGKPFKDFVAYDKGGKAVRLSECVKPDRFTLLIFWLPMFNDPEQGETEPVFEKSSPDLTQFAKKYPEYQKAGLDIVAVCATGREVWEGTIEATKTQSYTHLFSSNGNERFDPSQLTQMYEEESDRQYRFIEYPETYLIGPDGKFVFTRRHSFRAIDLLEKALEANQQGTAR